MSGKTYDSYFKERIKELAYVEAQIAGKKRDGTLGDIDLMNYINTSNGLLFQVMQVVERLADKDEKQTSAVVPPETLRDLQRQIGAWARKTFPKQTGKSIILHLVEEVVELQHSTDKPMEYGLEDIADELADVVILAITMADKYAIDLESAVRRKHAINEGRKWTTDARGVHHHVR